MTLHLLNKSASSIELNTQLSDVIETCDDILLIESGVYHCQTTHQNSADWKNKANNIYVLVGDADARGVDIPEDYIAIDYKGFVSLSTQAKKVISWY